MALLYRAELALRRLLPGWAKTGWRLARLATQPAPPGAPLIPQHLIEQATLLTDRVEMLHRLPKGGRALELGTQYGIFAREILRICVPERLDIVDIDLSLLADDVRRHPAVTLHEALTTAYLASGHELFDWIYVDADHSYAAVKADIAASRSRVKPGGLLIFNDFARMVRPGLGALGVHQAVSEFIAQAQWPVVYFCLNDQALYDVALRRPEKDEGGTHGQGQRRQDQR